MHLRDINATVQTVLVFLQSSVLFGVMLEPAKDEIRQRQKLCHTFGIPTAFRQV